MASVMAIVSKAVFEKQARGLREGDVWSTDRYTSKGKLLETLGAGGSLFLVTVRPPEELWLVGVLDQPEHDGDAWVATTNTTAIRAIGTLVGKLVLHHGNGLTFEKGKLAMSLQGPRVLADGDVALLGGASAKSAKAAKPAKPAAKVSASKVSLAKSAVAVSTVAKPKAAAGPVSLDRVYAALDKRKPDEALAQLLAIWKSAPSPVIGEAIDVLSARIGGSIAGNSPEGLVRAWNKVEKAGNPADATTLLAEIRAGVDVDGVVTRFTRLESRYPGDPRLASFIHTQLTELAFTASSSSPVWTAMFRVLEGIPDPRTVGVVAATRGRWDKKLAKRGKYHDRFLANMDRCAEVAGTVTAPDVSRAAIARILEYAKPVASDDARSLAALFAEVYRDPEDDHVRSVLADALVEKADPRGELIHLQLRSVTGKLSADEKRRVKELVGKHGRAWLGTLGEWVSKNPRQLVYERGFATRVTLTKPSGKQPAYPIGAPEAGTIETIEVGSGFGEGDESGDGWKLRGDAKAWLRSFPHLHRLEIYSTVYWGNLVADGPVPYTEIVSDDPRKETWFTRKNFPKLERVFLPYNWGYLDVSKDWKFKKRE